MATACLRSYGVDSPASSMRPRTIREVGVSFRSCNSPEETVCSGLWNLARSHHTSGRLGLESMEEEVDARPLAVNGEPPGLARGNAGARHPRAARPGRHPAAPLVRRARDAQRLHDRRRRRLLRQPLPRQPGLPQRPRARRDPHAHLRERSVPDDLPARLVAVLARDDRQLQRERDAHGRALGGDDRDADRDRVRPRDAGDDRPAEVGRKILSGDGPPALRLRPAARP